MPPKSGRARAQKRNAKKKARLDLEERSAAWQDPTQTEARMDNRLVSKRLRWLTDASGPDLENLSHAEIRAKEIALLVTRRNMMNPDAGIANAAISNLIRMEAQNQKDEEERRQAEHEHRHLHLHAGVDPYAHVPRDKLLEAMAMMDELEAASSAETIRLEQAMPHEETEKSEQNGNRKKKR